MNDIIVFALFSCGADITLKKFGIERLIKGWCPFCFFFWLYFLSHLAYDIGSILSSFYLGLVNAFTARLLFALFLKLHDFNENDR